MTPEETCKALVDVILSEKQRRKLGLKRMAKICGVAPVTIQRWNTGKSAGNLYVFAQALDKLGYEITVRRKEDAAQRPG